jgi:hypothetical protein
MKGLEVVLFDEPCFSCTGGASNDNELPHFLLSVNLSINDERFRTVGRFSTSSSVDLESSPAPGLSLQCLFLLLGRIHLWPRVDRDRHFRRSCTSEKRDGHG